MDNLKVSSEGGDVERGVDEKVRDIKFWSQHKWKKLCFI